MPQDVLVFHWSGVYFLFCAKENKERSEMFSLLLTLPPRTHCLFRNRKSVCLVDLTGQNRKLPGLPSRKADPEPEELEEGDLDESTPWKAGFSETSGSRNK